MKRHQISLKKILGEEPKLYLVGAEIGVWKGETSRFLLATFPRMFLHMVDPWKVWKKDERYFHDGEMGQLSQEAWDEIKRQALENVSPFNLRCSIHEGLSEVAAQGFRDSYLDFVFLDASHFYEDVIKDIQIWLPKIKTGGLMLGHDYRTTGDRWGFGVKKAVDEMFGNRVFTRQGLIWGVRV